MYQRALMKNTLFYGDNLDILRQYVAAESIDLIYLDPPFNSNRNYNVCATRSWIPTLGNKCSK